MKKNMGHNNELICNLLVNKETIRDSFSKQLGDKQYFNGHILL